MKLIDATAMLERNKSSIYDTVDLEEMLMYEPPAYDINGVEKALKALARKSTDAEKATIEKCIKIFKDGFITESEVTD